MISHLAYYLHRKTKEVAVFAVVIVLHFASDLPAQSLKYDESYYCPFALAVKWDFKDLRGVDGIDIVLAKKDGTILHTYEFELDESNEPYSLFCFIKNKEAEIRFDLVSKNKRSKFINEYGFIDKTISYCSVEGKKECELIKKGKVQIGEIAANEGGGIILMPAKGNFRTEMLVGLPRSEHLLNINLSIFAVLKSKTN
jgi:hypothetical protein